jgi:hypothetical protein
MIYAVYDNERPAKYPEIAVDPSWNNNRFNSFDEALKYARNWLGPYGEGVVLKLGVPWDYSGYGDYIVIREE